MQIQEIGGADQQSRLTIFRQGAALAVRKLRANLHQTPDDATLQKLRGYLANPASLSNPNDHWAHNGLAVPLARTAITG